MHLMGYQNVFRLVALLLGAGLLSGGLYAGEIHCRSENRIARDMRLAAAQRAEQLTVTPRQALLPCEDEYRTSRIAPDYSGSISRLGELIRKRQAEASRSMDPHLGVTMQTYAPLPDRKVSAVEVRR